MSFPLTRGNNFFEQTQLAVAVTDCHWLTLLNGSAGTYKSYSHACTSASALYGLIRGQIPKIPFRAKHLVGFFGVSHRLCWKGEWGRQEEPEPDLNTIKVLFLEDRHSFLCYRSYILERGSELLAQIMYATRLLLSIHGTQGVVKMYLRAQS